MEPKKNPKADLTKNIGLYFVIGLCVTMFITWRALEWKTYDEDNNFDFTLNVEDQLDEEVPMTEQLKTPPPPPPPAAPEIIEVVEDEEEIEETVIESTETSQEEVIEIDDVVEEDFDDDLSIPFAVIEDVPIFPGCESEKSKGAAPMPSLGRKDADFATFSFQYSSYMHLEMRAFLTGALATLSAERERGKN